MKTPLPAWLFPVFGVALLLSGCQAPAKSRADRMVGVLDGFVVSHRRLPANQAELAAFAKTVSDRVAIRGLRNLSFRALGPATVRADYIDEKGVRDHYAIFVPARPPLRLTSGTDPAIFTEPHFQMTFRVWNRSRAQPSAPRPNQPSQ